MKGSTRAEKGASTLPQHLHRHGHDESMLSVEEALERILSFFEVLGAETKAILEAQGQVLADDITSSLDIPPLDNSAMDGFAVQSESVRGASAEAPVTLEVIGAIAAGEIPGREVVPGTAIRIMTGAPVPRGADAIVPFEDTDEAQRKESGKSMTTVGVLSETQIGANVRPAGQDVRNGDRVLQKGMVLRSSEIGVLASLGHERVQVVRRPTIAILATGNELIEADERYEKGKIYNSNTFSLAAAVSRAGGIPKPLGIASDDLESLNEKLDAATGCDTLITSAGVSKGDYDIVKDVLAQRGEVDFWSVRMRPAKPLAFGAIAGPGGTSTPHLGLPGNPVSALVAFEQFGRPAVRKMLGMEAAARPTIEAVLEEPIYNEDGRRVYARAIVTKRNGAYYAKLTGEQGSNLLTSMALANGLAICPEDVEVKRAGESVTVQMLDWPETVF